MRSGRPASSRREIVDDSEELIDGLSMDSLSGSTFVNSRDEVGAVAGGEIEEGNLERVELRREGVAFAGGRDVSSRRSPA